MHGGRRRKSATKSFVPSSDSLRKPVIVPLASRSKRKWRAARPVPREKKSSPRKVRSLFGRTVVNADTQYSFPSSATRPADQRSTEERRDGKGCVSTCRSRGSRVH